MESEGSLLCSKKPSTGPYPEPDESSPYHPVLFLQVPSYISLPSGLFHSGFTTKTLYASPSPHALYIPCSSSMIWSFWFYLAKSTSYEASHYVIRLT
jgi:hypothetical protein